jgi:two-component system sensor histidine kinase PilS (NtrC family)
VLGNRVRHADEALARTARELDRVRIDNDVILRHLGTGVLTVDSWGTVAYINPAAEAVLGVRTLECRGRRIQDALPERLAPLRDLVIDTLGRRSSRTRAELTVASAAGRELPLGISTNVLMHEQEPTGVVAVFSDLTEVREMERRARRQQALAEIGALAATIAHELRNGLKPIAGSIEFLQRELKPEGDSALLMELIARESSRLNRFVSDLLGYSRERDLRLETLAIEDVLADVVDSLRHDPRRAPGVRVRLAPSTDGDGALLSADREQLRQVWLNLAANALEAMPDGGELTIGWRWTAERRIAVTFDDTGSGIAAQDLPRIGEPFFTTKQGGTGLGLAIAQRIVERHGGALALDSTPGRGTTVTVTLPGTAAALAAA